MVTLKLVVPRAAAACPRVAAAAGSALPALADALGVPEAGAPAPGVPSLSAVQPVIAKATAAIDARPSPASRGVRMSVLSCPAARPGVTNGRGVDCPMGPERKRTPGRAGVTGPARGHVSC